MDYRKVGRELDEILSLLDEQIIDKHAYVIDLIREQKKEESGRLLVMKMESVQENLLHLAHRTEDLLREVENAERSGRE